MTHHIRDRPECRLDDEIEQILFDKRFLKKTIVISLLISSDYPNYSSYRWSLSRLFERKGDRRISVFSDDSVFDIKQRWRYNDPVGWDDCSFFFWNQPPKTNQQLFEKRIP